MKKVIIIASAIISILFAISVIIFQERLIVQISLALFIILISSSVIFNIKLPKSLRTPLAIISILMTVGNIALLSLVLFVLATWTNGDTKVMLYYIAFCLASAPLIITLITFIRRVLRPAAVKENK